MVKAMVRFLNDQERPSVTEYLFLSTVISVAILLVAPLLDQL